MTWVYTFIGLSLLIVLHEAGHFVAAKAVGMRVERFFLFFPPRLISKRIGETEYGIGAIPLGGFVKITGMNPEELEAAEHGQDTYKPTLLESIEGASPGPETPLAVGAGQPVPPEVIERAYYNQPVWKRIVVIGAGPAVNIVLAVLLFFVFFLNTPEPSSLEIGAVEPNTPAQQALMKGDRLVSVDGVPATVPNIAQITDPTKRNDALDATAKRLSNQINTHACPGQQTDKCLAATPAKVVVERNGRLVVLQLRPFYDGRSEIARHRLGFQFQGGGYADVSQSTSEAARLALDQTRLVVTKTLSRLAGIFYSASDRSQIHGIVGLSTITSEAFGAGLHEAVFFLLALISLSLGIINLLPFLPLDGGHIFWSLVEKVRGRRVPFSTMERASALGFMFFAILVVIGFTNDVHTLTNGGFNIK